MLFQLGENQLHIAYRAALGPLLHLRLQVVKMPGRGGGQGADPLEGKPCLSFQEHHLLTRLHTREHATASTGCLC